MSKSTNSATVRALPPSRGPLPPHKTSTTATSSSSQIFQRGSEPVPSLLNHYRGHKGPVLALAFHPNLQTVFSSSCDSYIMCWNYRKETRALRFEGHCGPVNDISLSKYGDLLLSASDDFTVRVWVPIISGQYISIKAHHAAVRSASFSPVDTTIFATASNDKAVKLWSVQAAKMKSGTTKFKSHDFLQSFSSHKNWVRSVRFSPDGRLLCTASDDKTVQVFDTKSKTIVAEMPCDLGSPLKAEFNPCGSSYIGVSTTQNAFLMYDVRERKLIQSYVNLFEGAVTSFAFHPSGDFAVCVSEDPKIKILDLIEGRPIFTLYGPRKGLCATAFNSTGSLFATGGKDDELLVWEPVLIPYPCADEKETEKENQSTSFSSAHDTSTSSQANAKSKVIQEPEIVKTKSKGVSLESLSRTSSARSASSASQTS